MKIFAIIGQPNAGKSTLFNVLSDIKTTTSNFAGTSVKVAECLINVNGETIKVVDLPGLYSLNTSDSAEQVTIDYLKSNNVDVIINVVDSTLLARSLELTYELMEFGKPVLVALNMIDEARFKGLEIFPEKISSILNVPVVPISAIYGKGVKKLTEKALYFAKQPFEAANYPIFTKHVEENVNKVENLIIGDNISINGSRRFIAIKLIENPMLVSEQLNEKYENVLRDIRIEISESHNTDIFEIFSYERHHFAMKTAELVSIFTKKNQSTLTDKLDSFLLHPVYGYIVLIIFHVIIFVTIFFVGGFLSELVSPVFEMFTDLYKPLKDYNIFLWTTVDGIGQGFIGALGIVLPYFFPLILLNAIFEETGYLARIAFLIDNLMHKIGLHGKSVAAFILGVGCSVPAIYATRILDSKRDRMLTGILIPFVPCSARIAVIFALTAAFAGPVWAVVIFIFVILVIAVSGKFLSKFMNKPAGLILEIPELRRPVLKIPLIKTYYKIIDFLKDALPFLIIGSIILGWIELLNIAEYLNFIFEPVLVFVLGLPSELGSTLIFGFFRKELILVMANQSLGVDAIANLPLTSAQAIVFIVFVTLYFPCFTTFVVIIKEMGIKTGLLSAVLSIGVALISAFLFRLYFILVNIFFIYL